MNRILGIDPGPEKSAFVVWNRKEGSIIDHLQADNVAFRERLLEVECDICVVEDVVFYGKVLNNSTFETLRFIGRIQEIFNDKCDTTSFPTYAYYFCNRRQGVSTAQVNAVLRARFGEKGTKKNPGKLYGIKEHEWSALAVAVYYSDKLDGKAV